MNPSKKEAVDVVFVSPLRRALQTAAILFEDNPGNPKFIALPSIIEKFNCAGDLCGKYESTKREFTKVDFGLIDKLPNPDFWFLEPLTNLELKTPLLEKLKEQILLEDFPGVGELLLSEIARNGKHPEEEEDLLTRVKLTKEYLKTFILENGADKKYAVVSHATYLNRFMTIEGEPAGWLTNCQSKEYSLEL